MADNNEYDLDKEDEELFSKNKNWWHETYAFKVYKAFGIMHLIVALIFVFCYIAILLPAFIKYGYDSLNKFISFLAKGEQMWIDIYWGCFIMSLVSIVIVFIANKVADQIYSGNKNKKISDDFEGL
jgi:hypothetical protein